MTIVAIRDRHTVALAKWKLLTSPYPGGILKRELAPPSRSTLGCNNPPGFTNMAATPASEIPCKEKDRLMRLYIVAASDYSRAVQLLQRSAGVMKKPDCDELRGFAEEASVRY
jgi:hypothetical protein